MNLGQKVQKYLSDQANVLIQSVAQIASDNGNPTYLVGGAVRDIQLGRPSNDLDFVTVGSGIELAHALAKKHGGELTPHPRFSTAVWTPPATLFPYTIDCITARKETYAQPAALPNVTPALMTEDLFRRDFTINAMAMRLDEGHFGELLDLYNGRTDLENHLIRVLHNQSFEDDPTRIFRALRYAGRLAFQLEEETEQLLADQRVSIRLLSADRVRHEFEKILAEDNPAPILHQLKVHNCLTVVSERLFWNETAKQALDRLDTELESALGQKALAKSGLTMLRFLSWICTPDDFSNIYAQVAKSLNFPAGWLSTLKNINHIIQNAPPLSSNNVPSQIEQLFRGLSETELLLLRVSDHLPQAIHNTVTIYFETWQHIKPEIDGGALIKMGLRPGPQFKVILDKLLAAKLDGKVNSKQDEIDLVNQISATWE